MTSARADVPGPAITTRVSEAITLRGVVSGQEDLHVAGRLEGSVRLAGRFVVEASGVVKADVVAVVATIAGVLVGDVEATEKIELVAGARVLGDLRAPKVCIAEGAQFAGRVRMGEVQADAVTELPARAEVVAILPPSALLDDEGPTQLPEPAALEPASPEAAALEALAPEATAPEALAPEGDPAPASLTRPIAAASGVDPSRPAPVAPRRSAIDAAPELVAPQLAAPELAAPELAARAAPEPAALTVLRPADPRDLAALAAPSLLAALPSTPGRASSPPGRGPEGLKKRRVVVKKRS